MRYVSRIETFDGRELHHMIYRRSVSLEDTASFTVYSGEKGVAGDKAVFYSCAKLDLDVLGTARGIDVGSFSAVVTNDAKTIQAHNYVEYIGSLDLCASSCKMYIDCDLFTRKLNNCINLVMLQDIRVFGASGSVIVWHDKGEVKVYNLYEFLCKLCESYGRNFLKYQTIRLYMFSDSPKPMLVIRLRHNAEADRFFTKMLVDIGRS